MRHTSRSAPDCFCSPPQSLSAVEKGAAMHVRNLSIRSNLTLLVLSASALAVLLASVGFGIYERQNYRTSAVRELTALADTLGANSAASMAFDDAETAQELLGALATEPHVLAACLYNNDGSIFA